MQTKTFDLKSFQVQLYKQKLQNPEKYKNIQKKPEINYYAMSEIKGSKCYL